MATCPKCKVSTRITPGAMRVEPVLVARPLGSFSLAGAQMKVSARSALRLSCNHCDFEITGRVEGSDFIADALPEDSPNQPNA